MRTRTETRLFATLTSYIALICRQIKTRMSRILLKEIISLKNQNEVYLVRDHEGVFVPQQKYSLTLRCRRNSCNKRMRLNSIKNVR